MTVKTMKNHKTLLKEMEENKLQRWHPMFIDEMNYYENICKIQCNLLIKYNHYENPNYSFYESRKRNSKIIIKLPKLLNS